jgi:hypothetical protein
MPLGAVPSSSSSFCQQKKMLIKNRFCAVNIVLRIPESAFVTESLTRICTPDSAGARGGTHFDCPQAVRGSSGWYHDRHGHGGRQGPWWEPDDNLNRSGHLLQVTWLGESPAAPGHGAAAASGTQAAQHTGGDWPRQQA